MPGFLWFSACDEFGLWRLSCSNCGGSAIAVVGPAMQASIEEMALSLGAEFVLNR